MLIYWPGCGCLSPAQFVASFEANSLATAFFVIDLAEFEGEAGAARLLVLSGFIHTSANPSFALKHIRDGCPSVWLELAPTFSGGKPLQFGLSGKYFRSISVITYFSSCFSFPCLISECTLCSPVSCIKFFEIYNSQN
jgi:hypothetical protein